MGIVTALVKGKPEMALEVVKDRKASPANIPNNGAGSVAFTWDGKIAIQNAQVYRHWAKTSEWVRGACNIRRTQVSSAEWDIVPYDQRRPYSKRQQDKVRALFRRPNPANDSYRGFIEPVTQDLMVLDAGCIEKVRNLNGELLELWPVNAAQIKVDALWDGNPRKARYFWYPDGFTQKSAWLNDDFIYMMMNPGTDTPIGVPALETLRAAVEAEMAAHEYNRRQVENAAPDGIINLGEGFTETQVNRFREFFESEVAGRGPLGFIGGSKAPSFIKFRDSNRDQQFLEWQIYLVRKIAVVFGLTPQDLGVTFDVNRSTSEIQLQVSEDRGLRPLMSNIQEYLTEEVVWDSGFGGPENNLAFRFTALNLKESTAKAAIYEKALAGVPWRFINEARVDEGREPIPELEGKLIMQTSTGAVDIMDMPTARELLEAQTKKNEPAPPAAKEAEGIDWVSMAEAVVAGMDKLRAAPAPEIHTHIDKGAVEVNVAPPVVNSMGVGVTEASQLEELTASIREATAQAASVPPPIVNIAPPVVNVAAPDVHVDAPDTKSFTDALNMLREAIERQEQLAAEPKPVTRREVIRDDAGRIVEVIDHRGV